MAGILIRFPWHQHSKSKSMEGSLPFEFAITQPRDSNSEECSGVHKVLSNGEVTRLAAKSNLVECARQDSKRPVRRLIRRKTNMTNTSMENKRENCKAKRAKRDSVFSFISMMSKNDGIAKEEQERVENEKPRLVCSKSFLSSSSTLNSPIYDVSSSFVSSVCPSGTTLAPLSISLSRSSSSSSSSTDSLSSTHHSSSLTPDNYSECNYLQSRSQSRSDHSRKKVDFEADDDNVIEDDITDSNNYEENSEYGNESSNYNSYSIQRMNYYQQQQEQEYLIAKAWLEAEEARSKTSLSNYTLDDTWTSGLGLQKYHSAPKFGSSIMSMASLKNNHQRTEDKYRPRQDEYERVIRNNESNLNVQGTIIMFEKMSKDQDNSKNNISTEEMKRNGKCKSKFNRSSTGLNGMIGITNDIMRGWLGRRATS